jgi:translation elongation factor EF-G
VLDGGIVVFDAVQGVEPQSETVWRQADRYGVPRICFVNKMDRVGASYERTIESIRSGWALTPCSAAADRQRSRSFKGVVDLLTSRPSSGKMTWARAKDCRNPGRSAAQVEEMRGAHGRTDRRNR